MNKPKQIIIFSALIILAALYIFIQSYQDGFITRQFQQQNFELLNQLSGGQTGPQSLDFYLGKSEDITFGPLKSLFSGIALIIFILLCMPQATAFQFGLIIFFYLLLTKFHVLLFPPHGEAIYGPFSDAVWLLRHNMDYFQLLEQPSFNKGGPQIYPTSLYPLFLAWIMHLTPSAPSFLVCIHIIIFLFTAVMISLCREIFKNVFDHTTATLAALLVLAMPLVQSMSELINMEMPTLFFAAIFAHCLINRQMAAASFAAIGSLLVKSPGVICCVAALVCGSLLFLIEKNERGRIQYILWGLFAVFVAAAQSIIRSIIVGNETAYNKVGFLIGYQRMSQEPTFWLFLTALVLFLGLLIYRFFKSIKTKEKFVQFLRQHFTAITMFIMAGLWYALYLNFSVLNNRYKLLVVPFFIFCMLYIFTSILKNRKVIQVILILIVGFSFFCSHGFIFDRNVKNSAHTHNIFERSLEYRNDLKLYMKLAKELETHFSDFTIGAAYQAAQALFFREIGYVDKKLDIVLYGMKSNHEGLKDFTGLQNLDIRKTIWAGNYSDQILSAIEYPIAPNDKVIKMIESGDKKIYLFMGGFGIEKMYTLLRLQASGLLK